MAESIWVREKLKRLEDNLIEQPISRERVGGRVAWGYEITVFFPVVIQCIPAKDYNKIGWNPKEIINPRHFQEAMLSYGMHSPYVEQISNNWATQNGVIPQGWKGFVTAILEAGSQL